MKHFDPAAMHDDLMGSAEIVCKVLTRYVDWAHGVEQELELAATAGDFGHLGRLAHSLRGTLAQLHACAGVALATAVEHRCRQLHPIPPEMLAELRAELAAITTEVRLYLARPAATP